MHDKKYEVKNCWKNSSIYKFENYNITQRESIDLLVEKSYEYGYYLNDLLLSYDLLQLYKSKCFSLDAKSLKIPYPFYSKDNFQHVEFNEIPCYYSKLDPAVFQINVFALSNEFDFEKTIKEIQEHIVIFRYQHMMKLSSEEYSVAKKFILTDKINNFDISSNRLRTIGIVLFENELIDTSSEIIREFLFKHDLFFYKNNKCNISKCKICQDLESCTHYLNEAKRITKLCIKAREVLSTKTKSKQIDLPNLEEILDSNMKVYNNFWGKLYYRDEEIPFKKLNKFIEEDPSSNIYEEIE